MILVYGSSKFLPNARHYCRVVNFGAYQLERLTENLNTSKKATQITLLGPHKGGWCTLP